MPNTRLFLLAALVSYKKQSSKSHWFLFDRVGGCLKTPASTVLCFDATQCDASHELSDVIFVGKVLTTIAPKATLKRKIFRTLAELLRHHTPAYRVFGQIAQRHFVDLPAELCQVAEVHCARHPKNSHCGSWAATTAWSLHSSSWLQISRRPNR